MIFYYIGVRHITKGGNKINYGKLEVILEGRKKY
jgi:hypothetical protein